MAAETYTKNAGVWTQQLAGNARPWANVAGVWKGITTIHVNVSGAWQQAYQYDVSAPIVRAFTVVGQSNANMRFAWSGGALVTDSSGVASVKIQQQYTPNGGSGEGWTDARTLTAGEWAATSGFFDFTPSTSKRFQQASGWPYATTVSKYKMDFRVVAVDALGNTMTTGSVSAFTKPYGNIHLIPSSQDSFLMANVWCSLANPSVQCGDGTYAGAFDQQYGAYFYETAAYDSCLGYTPNSGTAYIQRYSNAGLSGNWYIQAHNLPNHNSGAATFGGTVYTATISGTDDFESCAIPSDWLSGFASGSLKGFGMIRNGSTTWHVLYSWGQSFSDSGHVTLVFS